MTPQLGEFLQTAFISLGIVIFGLIGVVAKNWVQTVVLKWPTREEQTRMALRDILEQHEQYKSSARLVSKRGVDKWVMMLADLIRELAEQRMEGCADGTAFDELSDRIDLIGESARYMQVELYMTSVDRNGWEKKTDLEWNALCDELFASIETATMEYYRTRFKSGLLTWRCVTDMLEDKRRDFREAFDVCMTALKALSKEYHAIGKERKK